MELLYNNLFNLLRKKGTFTNFMKDVENRKIFYNHLIEGFRILKKN